MRDNVRFIVRYIGVLPHYSLIFNLYSQNMLQREYLREMKDVEPVSKFDGKIRKGFDGKKKKESK